MTHEVFDTIRDWIFAVASGLVLFALNRHYRDKDAHAKEFSDLKDLVHDLRAKVSEVCGHIGIHWP